MNTLFSLARPRPCMGGYCNLWSILATANSTPSLHLVQHATSTTDTAGAPRSGGARSMQLEEPTSCRWRCRWGLTKQRARVLRARVAAGGNARGYGHLDNRHKQLQLRARASSPGCITPYKLNMRVSNRHNTKAPQQKVKLNVNCLKEYIAPLPCSRGKE